LCCGELADAAGVVDLEAGADAAGGVATYPVEMGQGVLGENDERDMENKKRGTGNLDKVVFEQVHAEDVNHRGAASPSLLLFETRFCPIQTQFSLCFSAHTTNQPLFIIMSNIIPEGRREDALVKQRNQAREEYERQKQQLINETEKARPSAHRFVGQNDSMEDSLKNSTVGLVRLEDFQQKRKELEEAKAREAARTDELK